MQVEPAFLYEETQSPKQFFSSTYREHRVGIKAGRVSGRNINKEDRSFISLLH